MDDVTASGLHQDNEGEIWRMQKKMKIQGDGKESIEKNTSEREKKRNCPVQQSHLVGGVGGVRNAHCGYLTKSHIKAEVNECV